MSCASYLRDFPDLQLVYRSVLYSSFRGYRSEDGERRYTEEEVAEITYRRLTSMEDRKSTAPLHTLVFGPFSDAQYTRIDREIEQKRVTGVHSAERYRSTSEQSYLVLRLPPPAVSVFSNLLPSRLAISERAESFPIRFTLPLPPLFPAEVFSSPFPTKTVLVLNIRSTLEEILVEINERFEGVEHVKYAGTSLYVYFYSLDSSCTFYDYFIGKTVNGHDIFITYYPDALSGMSRSLESW